MKTLSSRRYRRRRNHHLHIRRLRSIISYAIYPPFALTQFCSPPSYPTFLAPSLAVRSLCLRRSNRCSPFTVNSARRMPRVNREQLHDRFGVLRKRSCAPGGHHQTLLPRALPRDPCERISSPCLPCSLCSRTAEKPITQLPPSCVPYANEDAPERTDCESKMDGPETG